MQIMYYLHIFCLSYCIVHIIYLLILKLFFIWLLQRVHLFLQTFSNLGLYSTQINEFWHCIVTVLADTCFILKNTSIGKIKRAKKAIFIIAGVRTVLFIIFVIVIDYLITESLWKSKTVINIVVSSCQRSHCSILSSCHTRYSK